MLRLFVLVLTLLISCSKGEKHTDLSVLRVSMETEPQTLDPRKARDSITSAFMHMLYEGLTRVSKKGKTELSLAKSVKISPDGLLYEFSLKNAFWSNQKPVTSFDFANSWRSSLDPNFPSDTAFELYVIKNAKKAKLKELSLDQVGIYTPDAKTLVVELEAPTSYFLELLTLPVFLPLQSEIVEKSSWDSDFQKAIFNGPFKIASWSAADQISLQKNPNYFESKEVKIDQLHLTILSSDTHLRMFEEKKLDWAGSPLSLIPPDATLHFKEKGELQTQPLAGTCFFRVNTKKAFSPCRSALMRKALAYAVDRSAIAEHVLQGGHSVATALVPPSMELSKNGYFPITNLSLSRELFDEALKELGMEKKDLKPLVISYFQNGRTAPIVQAVAKQWEEAFGISVEIEAIEGRVFFKKISEKDFEISLESWIADFNDPINFLEVFKYRGVGSNNTGWENSKYIDLLNESSLCNSVEKRRSKLCQAEQILMDEMPIIPVFHYVLNFMQDEKLHGVVLSPTGQIDFRWAYKGEKL